MLLQQPEGRQNEAQRGVHAAPGHQVLLDVRKVHVTLGGFYRNVGMWPNPTHGFAHNSTGEEREGPLAWSEQLHNADTFSLTSVKLGRKGKVGGGGGCTSLGIKKKTPRRKTSDIMAAQRLAHDATVNFFRLLRLCSESVMEQTRSGAASTATNTCLLSPLWLVGR